MKLKKIKGNTELLQKSWYKRSNLRVVFFMLPGIKYIGINNSRRKMITKKLFAKYVCSDTGLFLYLKVRTPSSFTSLLGQYSKYDCNN